MALSASGPGTSVRDQGSSGAEAGGGPIALTVLAMRCHTGAMGRTRWRSPIHFVGRQGGKPHLAGWTRWVTSGGERLWCWTSPAGEAPEVQRHELTVPRGCHGTCVMLMKHTEQGRHHAPPN
jgi:hypothetical protein